MKQKTTAQIREEVRKEMVKKFEAKYQGVIWDKENFQNLYHNMLNKNRELYKQIAELKDENLKLKDEITKYKDWVERLHEFMGIEDEKERKAAFETYINEQQTNAEINILMEVYMNMFNRIFSI